MTKATTPLAYTGQAYQQLMSRDLPPKCRRAVEMLARSHHELESALFRLLIGLRLAKYGHISLQTDGLGPAVFTTRDAMLRSVIPTLVALYDTKPNSVNLLEVINTLLQYAGNKGGAMSSNEAALKRRDHVKHLRCYQRRFSSKGNLYKSLADLRYVRHKGIGHLDPSIVYGTTRGSSRDITRVLVASFQIVRDLNAVTQGPCIDPRAIYKRASASADALYCAVSSGDKCLMAAKHSSMLQASKPSAQ